MAYKEKLKADIKRIKEVQKLVYVRGYSDLGFDSLLDCCEALVALFDQLDGTVYNTDSQKMAATQLNETVINSWHNVKDKLPIVGDLVIVSICDTSGDTSHNYTSVGWYSGYDGKWIVDNEFNNYVYAWMPFPEPSKKEKI